LSNQLSCSISDIALLGRAAASSEVIATTQAGSLGHDREDGNEASLLDSILDRIVDRLDLTSRKSLVRVQYRPSSGCS
jgi:hypothetical protein